MSANPLDESGDSFPNHNHTWDLRTYCTCMKSHAVTRCKNKLVLFASKLFRVFI